MLCGSMHIWKNANKCWSTHNRSQTHWHSYSQPLADAHKSQSMKNEGQKKIHRMSIDIMQWSGRICEGGGKDGCDAIDVLVLGLASLPTFFRRMYWEHFVFTLAAINRLIFVQLVQLHREIPHPMFLRLSAVCGYVFGCIAKKNKKIFGSHQHILFLLLWKWKVWNRLVVQNRWYPLTLRLLHFTAIRITSGCWLYRTWRKWQKRKEEKKRHKVCNAEKIIITKSRWNFYSLSIWTFPIYK